MHTMTMSNQGVEWSAAHLASFHTSQPPLMPSSHQQTALGSPGSPHILISSPIGSEMLTPHGIHFATSMNTRRSSDRKIGGKNMGSKHRGVTHHARTNRYEAHIWDDGRQVYLGGFYNEAQAALAYDLAAVRFRGEDSTLNYPRGLYTEEMQSRHTVTQEQVVTCLRDQSKSMNKVDQSSKAVSMQAWELQLSHVINPSKTHIGVYSSEVEAARAYDRALVNALGIEATPLLNFQLVEYIDALDASQVQEAIQKGLIPSVIPQSYSPNGPPTPIYQVESRVFSGEHSPISLQDQHTPDRIQPNEESPRGHVDGLEHGTPPPSANNHLDSNTRVHRRNSNTPRSVLEFGADGAGEEGHEVGDKRTLEDDQDETDEAASPEKRQR